MKRIHFRPLRSTLFAIFFIAAALAPAHALPSFEQLRQSYASSEVLLLDRHGEPLHRLRVDASVRRGSWVPLDEVSAALRAAIIVSEDKGFYQHKGVDWRAVGAAAWSNMVNRHTRGASTVTMQLAGLLDETWQASPGGRSPPQKLGQVVAAQVLERRWRKDQILEAYLNLVPFRGDLVGLDALSRSLFAKAPHGLDEREAALTAALVRGPNARPAVVAQRACAVLQALQQPTHLSPTPQATPGPSTKTPTATAQPRADCTGLELMASALLTQRHYAPSEGLAPHFARQALARRAQALEQTHQQTRTATATNKVPAQLSSSLHAPLQRFAVQTLQQHLRELAGHNVEDGALVVLDNRSGEVLAWVGSSGDLSAAAEVDGVLARRQPGSTLKPFLYAQAISERRLTAASLLHDAPIEISAGAGLYVPQNYDQQFKGWVSLRSALGASLNIPAVRTLELVSPTAFAQTLQQLGLGLRETGDYYGYSLALGSAEVSLLALSNAYRALANGGYYSPVRYQTASVTNATAHKPQHPALDPRAAFIVSDILADNNARAPTFGRSSVLNTRYWAAVKTGTSKDMRDNWAVGYSQRYTVGVWVGNASGAAMHHVSGASGAAPIWASLMNYLHQHQPSRAPAAPAGLTQAAIRYGDNLEAPRQEWFIAPQRQTEFALASRADNNSRGSGSGSAFSATHISKASTNTSAHARIQSPTHNTILALDPDIPPQAQRVQLSANSEHARDLRWWVNDKPFARGASVYWSPWPGRHRISLRSAAGEPLDEIRLEVRGAGLRAAAFSNLSSATSNGTPSSSNPKPR